MPTDYPPLPFENYIDDEGLWCEKYGPYAADHMHAYLDTERQRIERDVMPLLDELLTLDQYKSTAVDSTRATILRAIRGEKEPT